MNGIALVYIYAVAVIILMDKVKQELDLFMWRDIFTVVCGIGTWFHEFLYPLDYLSKYQKDKKKKSKKKILYSIIVKVGKQNRSPTEVV